MTFEDRKFQDGDLVIYNLRAGGSSEVDPVHDRDAVVVSIYTAANKSRGDWAYNISVGKTKGHNTVWGWQLRHAMYKYDPKQAGDTDEDI